MSVDRKEEGRKIAFEQPERMRQEGDIWRVKGKGGIEYHVDLKTGGCGCPDKTYRSEDNPKHRCKHFHSSWFTEPLPIEYRVGKRNGVWCVGIFRGGQLLEFVCPRQTKEEAEDAKRIMELRERRPELSEAV